jgi:hypothetical protein
MDLIMKYKEANNKNAVEGGEQKEEEKSSK